MLTFFIFLLFSTTISIDYFELWSIEQLDDMILSDAWKKDVPARTPAVIALYEKQCMNEARGILLSQSVQNAGFPNSMHLIFASFDRTSIKKNIWYKYDIETMDAFHRYNISTTASNNWCPTFIFQPGNWSKSPIIWNKKEMPNFVDWIWARMRMSITFENTLDKLVNIVIESINHELESDIILSAIHPNKNVVLPLHAADVVTIKFINGETVNRYIINTVDEYIKITKSNDDTLLDPVKFENDMNQKYELRNARDWSTRRRYLNNIRTPPVMPGFTKAGFLHKKLPDNICKYLQDFYKQQESHAVIEGFPKDGTQINAREIDTWMMHIPYKKKLWISNILQKDLEKWAKKKLQHVTIYGLREYRKGAVLKTHVDRIETHIISAILHVTHKPNNISWPIEVVGFDGERYEIMDTDCDLVYYESSKLIHGRPTTYKGDKWVNAFLHFKPVDWNGYRFTDDNVIITPEGQTPLVDFVYG